MAYAVSAATLSGSFAGRQAGTPPGSQTQAVRRADQTEGQQPPQWNACRTWCKSVRALKQQRVRFISLNGSLHDDSDAT